MIDIPDFLRQCSAVQVWTWQYAFNCWAEGLGFMPDDDEIRDAAVAIAQDLGMTDGGVPARPGPLL